MTAGMFHVTNLTPGSEQPLQSKHLQLLTAGMLHVTNLTSGSGVTTLLAGYRLSEACFVSRDPLHAAFVAAAASCRAEVHRVPAPPPHDLASVAADARQGLPAPAALAGALVALETYKLAALRVAKTAATEIAAAETADAAAAASSTSSTSSAVSFRHSYVSMGTNLYASVGGLTRCVPLSLTHSLKAPGFNPWSLKCDILVSKVC
jgi:hypothetical protein